MKEEPNKKLNKNYIYMNIVLLVLSIYVIFFPFIARILEKISPNLVRCPYQTVMGKPCPLCGGTRYFAGLKQIGQNPSYLLHPFGIMAIVLVLEVIFRSSILIWYARKKKLPKRLYVIDSILHIGIILAFIGYEIWFFVS